ncbi:MAG: hypothetical protein R2883_06480 [Caldisericia bacterium]
MALIARTRFHLIMFDYDDKNKKYHLDKIKELIDIISEFTGQMFNPKLTQQMGELVAEYNLRENLLKGLV